LPVISPTVRRFVPPLPPAAWLGVLSVLLALPPLALAQPVDLANRPIDSVEVRGLEQVSETLVRNQIRALPGEPYDRQTVEQDIVRITHLGRFNTVRVEAEPRDDGSVKLIYIVDELPLISDVQVVGNKAFNDRELASMILLQAGDPLDPFLIQQAEQRIRAAYEDKGYFIVDVRSEQELLEDSGILIFRIREGPRVQLRRIEFQGNESFPDKQLRARVKSKTYIPIFRSGTVSREQLDRDAASIRAFYTGQGFLDAEVGRRIDISPDEKQAAVVFQIREGERYRVSDIQTRGVELFPLEQVIERMSLKVGDTFSRQKQQASAEALLDMYGRLGMIETQANIRTIFHETEPRVALVVEVQEGQPYTVGRVEVRGNHLTQDKVVLRQVRGMTPGRRFNRTGIEQTERRLRDSPYFAQANVTVLGDETQAVRDVLIDVEEQNTGSVSFGAGVSSDSGVVGAIDLTQRNFDIADFPESAGELFTGRAFRGAGQAFSVQLAPGSEVSSYSVSFREPYLLESQYFLSTSGFVFDRERDDYDEERLGGRLGLGQRFGDIYSASINARYENVDVDDIDPTAPVDVFNVQGGNTITSLGFSLVRDTTDNRMFPTRGSRSEFSIDRAGALGGDFDFTAVSLEFQQFWTVDQDFLGRKTVLRLRSEIGYIIDEDEAPVFERLYAGGHRSFRGFDFRGVGPRGVRNDTGNLGDEAVGGDFLFLLGLEYNFPVFQDLIRWVVFTDTGTVQDDIGFDEYRVSVGTGARFTLPFLFSAPIALDFAVPLLKEDGDEERLFSFDVALPLQ